MEWKWTPGKDVERSGVIDDLSQLTYEAGGDPSLGEPGVVDLAEPRRHGGGLSRVVDDDRHDELALEVDTPIALHCQPPLAPEVALVPALGVGGDQRDKARAAAADELLDLRV